MQLGNKIRDFLSRRWGSVAVARRLLGDGSVFSEQEVNGVWGFYRRRSVGDYISSRLIRFAKERNEKGGACVLIYVSGISLRSLRELKPEEFSPSSAWTRGFSFLNEVARPGYRVLDFNVDKPLRAEDVIGKSGLVRAGLSSVAEALISIRCVSGKRLLEDRFHRGDAEDGAVPYIGEYQDDGMLLHTLPRNFAEKFRRDNESVYCLLPHVKSRRSPKG